MFSIVDFRLPIADAVFLSRIVSAQEAAIQSAIGNVKKPRAKQRGAFLKPFSISLTGKDSPSCLADYFTWPQVALTHHAYSSGY
jgi:hypothetical protein